MIEGYGVAARTGAKALSLRLKPPGFRYLGVSSKPRS